MNSHVFIWHIYIHSGEFCETGLETISTALHTQPNPTTEGNTMHSGKCCETDMETTTTSPHTKPNPTTEETTLSKVRIKFHETVFYYLCL